MLRVFPVDPMGHPTFSDTWHAPREGGRVHEGVDIFAPEGTPVRAVDGGELVHQSGKLGGNVAVLRAADGTSYVYSHLSAYEGEPRKVRASDVIGYVGHTGNAAHTPPHCHFETHYQGEALNPYAALRALVMGSSSSSSTAPGVATLPGSSSSSSSSSSDGALLLGLGLWWFTTRKDSYGRRSH